MTRIQEPARDESTSQGNGAGEAYPLKDFVIDLVCYRRWGHNEGDDPTYTQPVLYREIAEHPTAATLYRKRLISEGVVAERQVAHLEDAHTQGLEKALEDSAKEIRLEGDPWL